MEKYDITKPMKIPVGMHKLNGEPGISFQLNRLVNMDGCDLAVAKEIGPGSFSPINRTMTISSQCFQKYRALLIFRSGTSCSAA